MNHRAGSTVDRLFRHQLSQFNNHNQRFNVCCFHACTGQTVPSLFPFSISPYHAHHTPLAQALSCPPPHTLSMSSCPYLYPSYQKPLASGTLSPSLHHPSSPRDQTISIYFS